MIHIFDEHNFQFHQDLIDQHHRVRHRVFVEERGWRELDRVDGREIDAYDTERTVYLLAVEDGRIIGGHRLLPTTGPHMLAEVFSFLAEEGVPTGASIMEWSRFFVVPERRGGSTFFELMAAVQEYGLRRSITHVTAVVEEWWLPKFDAAGFSYRLLGRPTLIEGVPTSAILIGIRPDSLRRVLEAGGLEGSVLAGRSPSLDPMATIGEARGAEPGARARAVPGPAPRSPFLAPSEGGGLRMPLGSRTVRPPHDRGAGAPRPSAP